MPFRPGVPPLRSSKKRRPVVPFIPGSFKFNGSAPWFRVLRYMKFKGLCPRAPIPVYVVRCRARGSSGSTVGTPERTPDKKEVDQSSDDYVFPFFGKNHQNNNSEGYLLDPSKSKN